MAKKDKSWEHRLSGGPDELAMNFVESLSYDQRLYKYDIAGSIAHSQMLVEIGILTKSEASKIKKGLLEIEKEIEAGKFKFDVVYEDIHMAVEAALTEKIGDAGKKLHTGRSRNDQVATDMRLWMRDEILNLQGKIENLQRAFVTLAEKNIENVMPAYTHLQRAQPVSIAGYLLSFVEMLARDHCRLGNCLTLANVSPLGSGAVAGSTIGLDRKSTAEKLGFKGVMRNSMDGISDRDFCAEFIFDCSMIGIHLSRLAEDFIIFSTSEFDFVRISDKYCTSSSMMPQKRNPDMLELIRGKSGGVIGFLTAMLTMLKAQPSTYNRDMQEDKLHVFRAADSVSASLCIATGIIENTEFKAEQIRATMDTGFLDATALAEYLVKKGVPFRQGHGIVGSAVAKCEKENKKLGDLTIGEFKKFSDKIEDDVYGCLGGAGIVKQYKSEGAGGTKQARKQVNFWKKKLFQDRVRIN